MKLYIHEGNGHYIGSTVIVWADSRERAESTIRTYLDSSGLRKEALNVTGQGLVDSPVPTILFSRDGDY